MFMPIVFYFKELVELGGCHKYSNVQIDLIVSDVSSSVVMSFLFLFGSRKLDATIFAWYRFFCKYICFCPMMEKINVGSGSMGFHWIQFTHCRLYQHHDHLKEEVKFHRCRYQESMAEATCSNLSVVHDIGRDFRPCVVEVCCGALTS